MILSAILWTVLALNCDVIGDTPADYTLVGNVCLCDGCECTDCRCGEPAAKAKRYATRRVYVGREVFGCQAGRCMYRDVYRTEMVEVTE